MSGLRTTTRNSTGTGSTKIFLLSGLPESQRKDLLNKINHLGGKVLNVKDFRANCTHLICDKLSRSEKYLGACCTGKWVLHPSYVENSYKVNEWLNEEDYEWCSELITQQHPVDLNLAFCARRWRFLLGDRKGAFSGWKVAVVAGANRSKVIKRLLISGGAEVYNLQLPVKHPGKVADTIGYVFVSENNLLSVSALLEYGVLCVKPEYIGDYLIKDPTPDPVDYLVQLSTPPYQDLPSSQDTFLMASQSPIKCLTLQTAQGLTPSKDDSSFTLSPSTSQHLPSPSGTPTKAEPRNTRKRAMSKLVFDSTDLLTDYTVHNGEEIPPLEETPSSPKPGHSCGDLTGVFSSSPKPGHSCGDLTGVFSSSPKPGHSCDDVTKVFSSSPKPGHSCCDLTGVFSSSPKPGHSCGDVAEVKETEATADEEIVDLTQSDGSADEQENHHKNIPETENKTVNNGLEGIEDGSASKKLKYVVKVEKLNDEETKENIGIGKPESDLDKANKRANKQGRPINKRVNAVKNSSTPFKKRKLQQSSVNLNLSPITKFFKPSTQKEVVLTADSDNIGNILCDTGQQEKVKTNASSHCERNEQSHDHETLQRSNITNHIVVVDENSDGQESQNVESGITVNMGHETTAPSVYCDKKIGSDVPSVDCDDLIVKDRNIFHDLSTIVNGFVCDVSNPNINESSMLNLQRESTEECRPSSSEDQLNKSNLVENVPQDGKIPDLGKSLPQSDDKSTTFDVEIKVDKNSGELQDEEVKEMVVCDSEQAQTNRKRKFVHDEAASEKDICHVNMKVVNRLPLYRNGAKRRKVKINNTTENNLKDIVLHKQTIAAADMLHVDGQGDVEPGPSNQGFKKISIVEWSPRAFLGKLGDMDSCGVEAEELPSSTTALIDICIDDDFQRAALSEISSRVSYKYVPRARTVSCVMRKILLRSEDERVANNALNVLLKIVRAHPPVTRSLQALYLQALAGERIGDDVQIGEEWNFIKDCVYGSLVEDEMFSMNNLLCTQVIFHLLKYNLQHFMYVSVGDHPFRNMLVKIIWPSLYVTFDTRCRECMDMVKDVLTACVRASADRRPRLHQLLGEVVWLAAMVTETSLVHETIHERDSDYLYGLQALQLDKVSVFVAEFSTRISSVLPEMTDYSLLQFVFSSIQLPWLQTVVCQQVLDSLDDYLLTEHSTDDFRQISLSVIVNHYIYLLPSFHNISAQKEVQQHSSSRCKQAVRRDITKVNHKGESPLHVACIKNDVSAVKRLLKTPGVDVNVRDNAGWTPLHEAANHGHIECVLELTKFVPSRINSLPSKTGNTDVSTCRRVDMMASTAEGITPLHDAVLNNRLEVCRLLIQHGGQKLLGAKTCFNYTPLDLATTDEMRAVLLSPGKEQSDTAGLNISEDFRMISGPQDDKYNEVLYVDGVRVYSETLPLVQYVQLVTVLINQYLLAERTLRTIIPSIYSLGNLQCVQCSRDKKKTDLVGNSDIDLCNTEHMVVSSQTNSCDEQEFHDIGETFCDKKVLCQCDTIDDNGNSSQRTFKLNTDTGGLELEKDVKILKDLKFYLNLFQSHILRLCNPGDTEMVQKELQELYILANSIHSTL